MAHWDRFKGMREPVVYFGLRDGLIKIGHSARLPNRMATVLGTKGTLLAVEPGGREREIELHKQFEALRKHGEWFRPRSPLTGYIDNLQKSTGFEPHYPPPPKPKPRRLTKKEIAKLWTAYKKGESVGVIAEREWEKLGLRSAKHAEGVIAQAFHSVGHSLRTPLQCAFLRWGVIQRQREKEWA